MPRILFAFPRRSTGRKGHLVLPLIILMLAALACSLPNLSRDPAQTTTAAPTPAPVEQTLAVAPQPTQSQLPPALVEVEPVPNSELAAQAGPVFYFSQPMDRASVESAVQSSVGGRVEWIDDSTMRFIPGQPSEQSAGLIVTINTTARAANGLALAEAVEVSYQSPGPLRIAERLPAPNGTDINPSSAVVVTFNRPVVPLGADLQGLPAAFTLEPAANGRGEWLNTSTYIFYPEPSLSGGTQYTVLVDSNLTSTDGSGFDSASTDSLNWSFSTAAPQLVGIQPSTEQPIPLDAKFQLTFNQPMDPSGVQENFTLIGPDGSPVAGELGWDETATELTFSPNALLQRGAAYTLVLFGSARSQGGAVIGQDFAASLVTVPQFGVTQTTPAAGENLRSFQGYASIELSFSSPVAAGQDFQRLVTINPPVVNFNTYRSIDGFQLFVSGYFQPSTSYTLTLAPDLTDRWGAALGMPYAFTFTTEPASPMLSIPIRQTGAQTIFVPWAETSIPAFAVNITRLELSRGRLDLWDFIQAEQSWEGPPDWESKVDSSWVSLLYPERNVTETIEIPLSQTSDLLAPGLYFLAVNTTPALDARTDAPPSMLVVSPIQLTVKSSTKQVFVWAVKISDHTPVGNKQVSIYDTFARELATCTTDDQGVCQAEIPEREDPSGDLYAVIGQPGEPDFSLAASDWSQGISVWSFGLRYQQYDQRAKIYLYTDRPIYRPGQTVYFRAVARDQDNGRYFSPSLANLPVQIDSPYDPVTYQAQVLTTQNLPLSIYGTASGQYTLPDDARTGTYRLSVPELGMEDLYFEVAEYRKPEVDLRVQFANKDRLIGDDIQAAVSTRYFFGAPAGNLEVRWSLFRGSGYLAIPDSLTIGPLETDMFSYLDYAVPMETFLLEGTTQTQPDGTARIEISGAEVRERLGSLANALQELTLEVTVSDESGLPVTARDTLHLHPADYYIGVRPESWSVESGMEAMFYIRTVNWQGSPLSDLPLTGRFRKVTWVQQTGGDPSGPPDYRREYSDVGSTEFQTSQYGEARLAFTPLEPGTYVLEVTGEGGAITEQLIWVGGPGAAMWPNLPNQRLSLRADQQQYQPGQTAKIFIPNPFEKGALALVTVERGRVMRSQVFEISGASYELALPLSTEDAPNIYVSVVLLGDTSGRPNFRLGFQEVQVDPAAQLLQVEVATNPPEAQPGEQVTINIRVKNAAGEPVQGEFSLALVDKAVLALADPNAEDITEAFYGRQPLGVMSSMALVHYGGRFLYIPPGRGGGGGGDMVAPPGIRSQFEDTAFWSGTIETDVTGVAQVTVTLPDNLTTWRADVRGLTEDSLVGQAEADLVTSKPLLVRPVTPRFVVVGDRLELGAVVHNNTQETIQASVRLESAGFALDDPNQAVQSVEISAGERMRVNWWGTVQDVAQLDLLFSAEGGGLQDAVQPERGPLPVLRYSAPQTFGTTGLLNDAGERIELVNLPRSFTPTGGELRLELSPSLTATVLDGIEALDAFPRDFTEPVLSRLLPNLSAYLALRDFQLEDEALRNTLGAAIIDSVDRLVRLQNENGGWGWSSGFASDPYITSYVLLGLSRAAQAGVFVDPQVLQKGQEYLAAQLVEPSNQMEGWQMDRLAFQLYVLQQAGLKDLDLTALYNLRSRLSPWGQAFLALTLEGQSPGEPRARTLVSDLQASPNRTSTGASWQDPSPGWRNWSTPNFTTAVVVMAIARLDPASPVLVDAVRYLVLNRHPSGAWSSSYESSWVLLALIEAMKGTGDLQAAYTYSASLNGTPLINGQVSGPAQAVNPVTSTVPLSGMNQDESNILSIQREAGVGRLYYRAFLQVHRPAEQAPAVNRGMAISRQYYRAGQDCRTEDCVPLTEVDLADPQPLMVRLTLTVPEAMYYVVVEDSIPAGTEVLNPRLKTSQRNIVPEAGEEGVSPYMLENPFEEGWGWWLFKSPQVYDERIRWVVDYLPAGTYELTYRLTPYLAGEFRLIPAHAWQYYFPEVEGSSAGSTLTIR